MKVSTRMISIKDITLFFTYACANFITLFLPSLKRSLNQRLLSIRMRAYGLGTGMMREICVDEQIKIKVDISERTGGDLFFGVSFEPLETEILKTLIGEDDVVADIGANIGIHTVILALRAGEAGRVHAFEPCAKPYTMLQTNIKLNSLTNVIINKLALSDASGSSIMNVNRESSLSSLGFTGRGYVIGEEEIEIATLDQYCESNQIPELDFIKLDVEGFEGKVLKGANRILSQSKDIGVLCELAQKNYQPMGFSIKDVFSYMTKHGFEAWELCGSESVVRRLNIDQLRTKEQNFLFLRPGGKKEELLRHMINSDGRLLTKKDN